jgi:hypothetical protein
MTNKEKIIIELNSYQIEWLESAVNRQRNGYQVDDGTLATLGQLLVDSVDLEDL